MADVGEEKALVDGDVGGVLVGGGVGGGGEGGAGQGERQGQVDRSYT